MDRARAAAETPDSYSPSYYAAMALVAAGWHVGPVRRGSKKPGSVLGSGWQHKTSRDPERLHQWWAESDHGVFLHVGRSGAVVFDVDNPDRLPPLLRRAFDDCAPPYQSTRADQPGRGHYIFAQPDGRRFGNSTGKLGGEWGEVRGLNGVIIVEPSEHPNPETGGRYWWERAGSVPVAPDYLATALPDTDAARDAASDAQVAAFIAAHNGGHTPGHLRKVLDRFDREANPGSRHEAAVRAACWAMREAFDGTYPAERARTELRRHFLDAVGDDRGSAAAARAEFDSIIAWAVAQATDGAVERLRSARAWRDTLNADAPFCVVLEARQAAVMDAGDGWRAALHREVAKAVWQTTTHGCPGLPRLLHELHALTAGLLLAEQTDDSDDDADRNARAHAVLDRALSSFKVAKELRLAASRDTPTPCNHPRRTEPIDTTNPLAQAEAAGVELGDVGDLRRALLDDLRVWLHLPEPAHVWIVLGAAVTAAETDTAPVWVQVVAASSLGKTEATTLLSGVHVGTLGEITTAGLLAWSKGKNPRPTGLLAGVRHGVVTFPDFSTLLAGSERGGSRDQVFAMLRQVYDGKATRTVQSPGAGGDATLHWQGRLTIISAVTTEIDRQLAHAQALGERWLYVRIAEPTRADQRSAARKAREIPGGVAERAIETTTRLVLSAQARLHEIKVSDRLHDAIEDAALITAMGRATVPRTSYGAQEITGPAAIEGVGRLFKQLAGLSRGLLALGLTESEVIALVRRVALDSMPVRRVRVLRVLAAHPDGEPNPEPTEPVDTAGLPDDRVDVRGGGRPAAPPPTGWLVAPLARYAGMDRKAVRRVLEEFDAIGLAAADADLASLPDGVSDGYRRWQLGPDMGDDVAAVLGAPTGTSRCAPARDRMAGCPAGCGRSGLAVAGQAVRVTDGDQPDEVREG